jgi:hypothetical protein
MRAGAAIGMTPATAHYASIRHKKAVTDMWCLIGVA